MHSKHHEVCRIANGCFQVRIFHGYRRGTHICIWSRFSDRGGVKVSKIEFPTDTNRERSLTNRTCMNFFALPPRTTNDGEQSSVSDGAVDAKLALSTQRPSLGTLQQLLLPLSKLLLDVEAEAEADAEVDADGEAEAGVDAETSLLWMPSTT